MQRGREVRIERLDQGRHRVMPALQGARDLGLAHPPVGKIGPQERAGIEDRRAMGGIEDLVPARDQLFQAAHIRAHVAIGRRHHGGGPAHHMIAREQRLFRFQRITHMVGGVSGREDALEAV